MSKKNQRRRAELIRSMQGLSALAEVKKAEVVKAAPRWTRDRAAAMIGSLFGLALVFWFFRV